MLKWMLTSHLNVKQQAHWLNQSACAKSINAVNIISYVKYPSVYAI